MVDELKEMGVELMISPYSHSVGKQSHNWAPALANKFLATDSTGQPASKKHYPAGISLTRGP